MHAAGPGSDTSRPRDRELQKLVGVSCPGCGTLFQTDRPQDPGYLTRNIETAPAKPSVLKSKTPKFTLEPNATSLSNSQYEELLKTLDPSILEEMGATEPTEAPGQPVDHAKKTEAAASEAGESDTREPLPIDRKPTLRKALPSRLVCHRCHSLSHHASPLANSSVLPSVLFPSPAAPVPKHIETLAHSKSAVVVLVVDLIDFPLSLPQPVIDELLKTKKKKQKDLTTGKEYPTTPIIMVGNKFDVMPAGTRKHKVIQTMQQYLERHGLDENIRAIHLVSAKNPVGDEIRLLLKSVATAWSKARKGNVVMVGAENVGKSQLLNAFLKESGRWRPSDQQIFQQKHGAEQLERQRKLSKLLGDSSDTGSDSGEDEQWSEMTGVDSVGAEIDQYESLYKDRGLEKLIKYQTTVSNVPGTTLERIKVPLSVLSRSLGANYKEVQTKWLMDTPGVRSAKGQLTSWLTLDELKVTLPKKMLKPATFTLEEGKSFFLGGLVRIDCIAIGKRYEDSTLPSDTADEPESFATRRARGSNPIPKITCFTTLPLHKTSTVAADRFLEKTLQGQLTVLQPPFGSEERLAAFPGLEPVSQKDIVIVNEPYSSKGVIRSSALSSARADPFSKLAGSAQDSESEDPWAHMTRQERENASLQMAGQYGICDLVFSGIGWVMVSGKFKGEDQALTLRVWTPKGQGAMVREMCLLPELAANPVDKSAGGIRQKQKLFQAMPKTSNPAVVEDIHTL
ncbi:hypothetical protein BGZ70_009588 [Mortierella alpina]|uniref:G domain-containing protein n=1 Tax=Mortierella alpina TaxID=64518 RepID=A0A9P6J0Y2_MORAP|nr:hypothetical protein BGZ70_009588 [Mortierella alpina]